MKKPIPTKPVLGLIQDEDLLLIAYSKVKEQII